MPHLVLELTTATRSAIVLCVLSLCAPGIPAARAQGIARAGLRGRISDPASLPIAGAQVTVSSSSLLGGARTMTSDDAGEYRVVGLPAGVYEITATHAEFATATRSNIIVGQDVTVTADFRLQVAAVRQDVTVTASGGSVDVTTSATPARLDAVLLEDLPTNRVLSDVMNLTPGVNGGIAMGGVASSNAIYVDGINLTSIQTGAPWAAFNYDWLDEVQVIGPGAGAQYSDFSGVVQKGRLKSGSDAFRGSGSVYFVRPNWLDSNTDALSASLQQTLGSRRLTTWHDESLEVGGPLKRGTLWGFGGVQHVRHNWTPALYSGPDSVDDTDRRMLAKVDGAVNAHVLVTGVYEHDRHRTVGDGLDRYDPIETTTTDTLPNDNWRATVRWTGAATLAELSTVGAGGEYIFDPTVGTRNGPAPHYDAITNMSSVNSYFFMNQSSRRRTVSGSLFADRAFGHQVHTFEVGGEFENAAQHQVYGYPGGRFVLEYDGVPTYAYIWPGLDNQTRLHRGAAYVQDRWTVGRLSVEPGIRFTFNRAIVSQGTVLSTNPVSPRLGVAWDVTEAHDTVVRVHAGRYHDALLTPNVELVRADASPDQIFAAVTGPDTYTEVSRSSSTARSPVDSQIAQPYFDQYAASLERAVSKSLTVTGQLLTRRYRNFMGIVDEGSVFVPTTVQDPGPDGRTGTADDGGRVNAFSRSGTVRYVLTNPTGLYRRYNAAQAMMRYRAGRNLEAFAAYSYTKTRGNVENTFRANAGGPELWTNGVSADPNRMINNDGPNTFDFTHEWKVLGTWHLPYWGGLVVSGVYRYHTGGAWGRSVHFTNQLNDFVTYGVRVEPRDARRTPASSRLDLRLEKQIPLRGGRRVALLVDGFNLTNEGIPDSEQRRAMWEVSGPAFGQPQYWVDPRSARAGVRLSF